MTVVKGHYDGQQVVFDEPVPKEIPPDTPVQVTFVHPRGEHVLSRIARLATTGGMPSDYSEQHEHYVKGVPKK